MTTLILTGGTCIYRHNSGPEKIKLTLFRRERKPAAATNETHFQKSTLFTQSSYFSFPPVLHDWCNKGHGMCYPVSRMVHIKEPWLLIGKSSPCGGSGFLISLSEWSFTISPMPYNRKIKCVEGVVK